MGANAVRLTTPENIRTLQRKLYQKAKREPGYRFYTLYDKVYRMDILAHAYRQARAAGGGAGADGRTFEDIERGEGVAKFLAELGEALRTRTYCSQAVLRVEIPKANGGKRPLGIPTIRDRVVQTATKIVLEPIFEADFCDCSYGFRPKRTAQQAIDKIADSMRQGYTLVIDADVTKCFDTIPHAKLLATVAERIADGAVLHLLKLWLKASVVMDKNGKRRNLEGGRQNRKGTPQGGVISPLLANLYLNLLDRNWERQRIEHRHQARLVRYADDFVVLCRKQAQAPMRMILRVMGKMGLQLNEEKTRVVNVRSDKISFLGFEIGMQVNGRTAKPYPLVIPSRKARKAIKARLTALTKRECGLLTPEELTRQINLQLRGWVGYFHYRNCSKAMREVKAHAEQRLRIWLRNRHKVRSWTAGYSRFPSTELYAIYGLYKVPTTAGWMATVHA
jgi:group II intron reverse transcriptase/maturase